MVSNSIAAMFWCLVLKTPCSLNSAESISAPCVIDFRSKETIAAVPDSHNLEGDRQASRGRTRQGVTDADVKAGGH